MIDRNALLKVLALMCAKFGKPVEWIDVETYAQKFANYPVAVLEKAIDRAVDELDQIPTIHQLKEYIADTGFVPTGYVPCGSCVDGWVEVQRAINVVRHGRETAPALARCRCWHEYFKTPAPAASHVEMRAQLRKVSGGQR